MAACTCAGIMAAPPFGTYTALVWSTMFLVLSFLSFFLWKKALWGPGQGRIGNKIFQPLKPVWCIRNGAKF
jgi:hypothetical protein